MSLSNIEPVGILENLKAESWRKVKATWTVFASEFYMDHSVAPTEKEITKFIKHRRAQGLKGTRYDFT